MKNSGKSIQEVLKEEAEKLEKYDEEKGVGLKGYAKENVRTFAAVLSNPPYQVNTGKQTSTDIYPYFQNIARTIADTTTMIYPASWQKSIRTGLGKDLVNNGLKESVLINGSSLFTSIRKNLQISLVHCVKDYTGEITSNNVVFPRDSQLWFNDVEQYELYKKTLTWAKIGIEPKDALRLNNIETSGIMENNFTKYHTGEDLPDGDLCVYVKKRQGKQADGGFYRVKRETVEHLILNPDIVDKYSVACPSSIFGRQSVFLEWVDFKGCIDAKVYPPHFAYSSTIGNIKTFDTFEEATNFKEYINTGIITTLIQLDHSKRSFAQYVPDLGDYTTGNPIFMLSEDLPHGHEYKGLNLNDRLSIVFNKVK